jgi:DNA-binding CsgD family transcriptional regulator
MAETARIAGRVVESHALSSLLTGQSGASAILVVADAGVGKSRLVAATAAAVAEDVTTLTGSCLPLSTGLAFLPVIDVLQALLVLDQGRLIKSALAECPAYVRTELTRLVPEIGPEEVPALNEPDEGWHRQRIFDSLRRLFASIAQQRRIGLVLEDLHWADATTLEFLDYLLAPGHEIDVGVVMTCRGDETRDQIVTDWLGRVQRNPRIQRLDLAPLTLDETAEHLELLLGEPPDPSLVEQTYARSEGNAFFTEQLIAARTGSADDWGLPTGLTALLLSRVASVAPGDRGVLAALAVAARPLDEVALAALSARSEPELRRGLRALLDRRLLRRPDPAGRYQLGHALLGEALRADLLPSERQTLHGRVAEQLADWNDPALAAQTAEHFAAAGRPMDELRWRIFAGRQANSVFAAAEAAPHWQRAVALCADQPSTITVEGMSIAQLYGAAEDALDTAGAHDAACLALAEEALDRLTDIDPLERADVLCRAGWMQCRSGHPRGLDLLRQAETIYAQRPPTLGHVQTLEYIHNVLLNDGRQAEAISIVNQAVAVAERAGHRGAQLKMLAHRATYEVDEGRGALAAEQLRSLRGRLTEQDGPELHAFIAVVETDVLLRLGQVTQVEDAGGAAIALAESFGMNQSWLVGLIILNVAQALIELGRTTAVQTMVPPTPAVPDAGTQFIYMVRAEVEALSGNLDEAQRRWNDLHELPSLPLAFETGVQIFEGELQLWQGDPRTTMDRSHDLLVEVSNADKGRVSGSLAFYIASLFALALRACADLADQARATRDDDGLADAQRCAKRLADLRRQMTPDPFSAGPGRPTADRDYRVWLGEWSRLEGASDATLWSVAAAEWDAMGRPHRAAYARWRQSGAILARTGDRPAAVAALRMAAVQAKEHVPLSRAIAELAHRARIDLRDTPAPVAQPAPAPPSAFGLTARELAVVRLVAEGLTNQEIGTRLFMSTKTASVHVSHILRKLDVATRVQAATLAERAGLLSAESPPLRPSAD